jgi:hypothetical protein
MATSRKPTSLGIPAPVMPAPTTPLRHKPPTLDLETPQTIDRGLVEQGLPEHTAIDDEERGKKFEPAPVVGSDTVVSPDPADPADTVDPGATAGGQDLDAADDPASDPALAAPEPPVWEEHSTIAEKSSSRRGVTPLPPARAVPAAAGAGLEALAEVGLTPAVRDDSARVLIDFDDSRVGGPTNIDDNAVASMPTALGPGASGTPSPLGVSALVEGRLVVIGGSDRGREFVLTARETSLGRGADNDIILTDIAVSRRHILLFGDGKRFGVRDLSSGNGTLVNGVRIVGDVSVHDGDQLELGNTLIRFEQSEAYSSVGLPPTQPANVVVGGGLLPLGMLNVGMQVPLPGLTPSTPGRLGAPLTAPFASRGFASAGPGQQQVFASAGGEVPPPAPDPAEIPEASFSEFVPIAPVTGPQHPSPLAMDLFRSQRSLLAYVGAGAAGFALLVWIVVRVSSRQDHKSSVVSTEAQTSPALNALLADVDKPETLAAPAAKPSPSPPLVASAALSPSNAVPAPASEAEINLTPPEPAPPPAPLRTPPATRLTPVAKAKPVPPRPPVRKVAAAAKPPVGSAAERSALGFYKARDFGRASDVLHNAAGRESGASADRLEALARDFAAVGQQLAKGDSSATSNPTAAMLAYKQAYLLDAKSGRGVHAPYLKAQLGRVLPRAASSFMSAGKFEQARTACDDAQQFGSGSDPVVSKVRGLLESKARELYTQGTILVKSKPDDAKGLWRRVLKMVPADSPWYSKSYAALNKSTRSAAQDEDE